MKEENRTEEEEDYGDGDGDGDGGDDDDEDGDEDAEDVMKMMTARGRWCKGKVVCWTD